ncbi:MAG: inorganic diphosphatase [Bacteroidia bacterium]|nr:MAG: inorganic diphosphatase [Bacteroidia bacterium]
MIIDNITIGDNAPEQFNVIIEIPANSDPIKYEIDKLSGALVVDRFVSTNMSYPVNYGFIPHTLSEDGDPMDVLVITPFPLYPSSVINCRPLGVLRMEDESGIDSKILALPIKKICPLYNNIDNINQLPTLLMDQLKYFFEHYKALEAGKWVKMTGWDDITIAKEEIKASIIRAKKLD